MIKVLEFIADYTGVVFGIVFAIIGILVVVRVIIKTKRGEKVEITPVGVLNDLPESVTGMNRHRDALDTNNDNERK